MQVQLLPLQGPKYELWNAIKKCNQIYHSPFEPECLDYLFHSWYQFMACTVNLLPSLQVWSLRSVKYKKRQERRMHQSGTAKEQCSQHGIFALSPIFCVKEPNTGIDAKSKATFPVWVGLKPVFHRKVCQGAHCACGFDNLTSY